MKENTALMKVLREVPDEVVQQVVGNGAAAGGGESSVKADIVMREGLGDNLPYPGADYLGIGYNLIEGNPEGDPLLQMDPGFRAPVIVRFGAF